MSELKVVSLTDGHYREPVHTVLRRIADDLEAGKKLGQAQHAVLVVETDTVLGLFTFGPETSEAKALLSMQAGAARIVEWYRGEMEG